MIHFSQNVTFRVQSPLTCCISLFSVSVPQSFKLLGFLDVQNTPCARDSILHGAGGSVAAGLLHFLATSESY